MSQKPHTAEIRALSNMYIVDKGPDDLLPQNNGFKGLISEIRIVLIFEGKCPDGL